MHLIHLKNYPIFKQLQLEEALLRIDTRNFCIINEGSTPAIVMGISGKFEELIDRNKLLQTPIPVIKRFSGGGTVVVDEETLFITFICQKELHPFSPYPEPIMRWTETIYKDALPQLPFRLRENDYVINERKCGGNAQYLCKDRWLHHTTFLWNYKPHHMDLLLHPKKTPKYREGRPHSDFLTTLSEHLESKEEFVNSFKAAFGKSHPFEEMDLKEVISIIDQPHRQSTEFV